MVSLKTVNSPDQVHCVDLESPENVFSLNKTLNKHSALEPSKRKTLSVVLFIPSDTFPREKKTFSFQIVNEGEETTDSIVV